MYLPSIQWRSYLSLIYWGCATKRVLNINYDGLHWSWHQMSCAVWFCRLCFLYVCHELSFKHSPRLPAKIYEKVNMYCKIRITVFEWMSEMTVLLRPKSKRSIWQKPPFHIPTRGTFISNRSRVSTTIRLLLTNLCPKINIISPSSNFYWSVYGNYWINFSSNYSRNVVWLLLA